MTRVSSGVSLLVTHFEFVSGLETSFAFAASLPNDWQSPEFIDFFLHCSLSKYPSADLKDLRHCSTSATTQGSFFNTWLLHLLFFLILKPVKGMISCVSGRWLQNTIKSLCSFLWEFFVHLSLSLPLCLSLSRSLFLTQRKYCKLTDSHWIHIVIHRPISNCQAAKLHKVCQNSSQEHAGDVKN